LKKKMKEQREKSKARIVGMLLENREHLQKKVRQLQLQIQEIDSIVKCIHDDCHKKY
jgi:hypothetical protein